MNKTFRLISSMQEGLGFLESFAIQLQDEYPELRKREIGNIDTFLTYISQAIEELDHIEGNLKN